MWFLPLGFGYWLFALAFCYGVAQILVEMGDMIPQLLIPPIPILPHDTWFLATPIWYLAHMMYFGVSGTCGSSVPSKRLFSKAGEVVAARRSNIKSKNVDMILFKKKLAIVFWHCAVFFFLFVWGRGQYHMVGYGVVSVYHVNTQYRIESPQPGIAHL